jgi:spore germination protein GerM
MKRQRFELVVVIMIALIALAGVLAAGCGKKPEVAQTTPGTSPGTMPSSNKTVSVFFLKGDVISQVSRAASQAGVTEALAELLNGPTDAEKQEGLATAIPAGTRLISFKVENGQATVDFSSELKNNGGGSASVQAIINQVTNTVTSNDPEVKSVEITVAGVPAEESLQP